MCYHNLVRFTRLPVRGVFDTNVFRGGLRSRRRPEYRCVETIVQARSVPLAPPALFLEYEEVLLRDATLVATGFSKREVEEFLRILAALVEPVRVDFDWRPLLPDPDDDKIANCALNGGADCVITSNLRHLRLLEERFAMPVLSPDDFLASLPANLEGEHDGPTA